MWFSATDAELPHGAKIADGMFNDHTCLRIMFGGRWTAETRDGTRVFEPGTNGKSLYFGPQSRMLRISVEGHFKVITTVFAPGTATVVGNPPQAELVDRIFDYDEMVGHGQLSTRFDPQGAPQQWLNTFETELRRFVVQTATRPPDPLTLSFEQQLLANPSFKLRDFAERHDVAARTLERTILRDYGLTPRQVRRRARALDLAAALLGVAMEDEEAALRLRYFDQSHQIREIRHFFDCTPGQLQSEPHPLLRLNLEVRQARRVRELALLPADSIQPWRDPESEPRG
jgi:AraC-like DNA-binding protein